MAKKRAKKVADDFVPPSSILWSEIGPKDFKARQLFMKLNSGFTHTVRFFHLPFKFWRMILHDRSQIISEDEAKQTEVGAFARYVINVIDRSDQQIKMLEGAEKLFLEFRRCHELTGINIGSMEGFDVSITVVGTGVSTIYRVSYDASKPTPFTDCEKAMLKEQRFHLPAIFTPSSPSGEKPANEI
jgi:hypothetical protein